MRHLRAGKKLGRNPSHRLALYRNLTMSLIRHERIVTTKAKAKAVRPFVEKLITLAVKAARSLESTPENPEPDRAMALHYRRLVISRLGPSSQAEVQPFGANGEEDESSDLRTVVQKLFDEIGPRFINRPGGYTRIIKRHQRRLGDGGETAYLELLKEGEEKVKAKQAAEAPAPAVEEEEEEEQEQEQQQEEQEQQEQESEEKDESQEEGEEKAESPAEESKPTEEGEQSKS